jgi:phage repressor protein C with HTH and peptisase S24 domain
MDPFTERFLKVVDYLVENKVVKSNAELARLIGMQPAQITVARNGKTGIPSKYLDKFSEKFNVNKEYVTKGVEPMWNVAKQINNDLTINAKHIAEIHYPLENEDDENPYIELPNGQMMMLVPLVNEYARNGYLAGFADPEYVETLPKHPLIVSKRHSGKYMAFESVGDSMFDGSHESIEDGDIVTGRDLPRHHWQNRFHINQYKKWIIVTKNDGILVKQITKHDFEKGIIICHSLNPDKDRYPDFELHLNEVDKMLNVVNISKPVR